MGWNNNYNSGGGYNNGYNNGGGYSNGGSYSRGGGYGRNSQYSRRSSGKKRSGAKSGQRRTGKPFVSGWKVSRQHGLISIICGPNKKTATHSSKSGREWENWTAKVTVKATGDSKLHNCLYDVQRRRVFIQDMGIMLSPGSPNGGYCGSFKKSNNNR